MSITLRAARVNRGLTQEKAAELLSECSERKYSTDMISNWERYKTFPDVVDIIAIENAYKISYNDINFLPTNYG